jgi:hypothetical protein
LGSVTAILGVEEYDRMLMAPKLLAKSRAMSANRSDEEIFKIRAVSAQIGWLETSMSEAAAHVISNVELLLNSGASKGSVAIDNQLMTCEAHEHGLLAAHSDRGGRFRLGLIVGKKSKERIFSSRHE